MKRAIAAGVVLFFCALSLSAADDPKPGMHEVKLNGHTFTLPDGFEIEVAAGPPLVDRPIVADFDEQGRLYVADSSGSNDRVEKQLQDKPHRIVRLEDTHGDGHFDKRTIFADKMMFPEGAMWYNGSLYVAAPPSIWKLTDTKHDGVADQRSEWFLGKTLTGCANDLHGPYLGPDGWIYWCKGAFARQTYERPGHKPFTTRAAHIFRSRPEGTGIEPVMTGGMDNPVTVVWTPGGERIFTTTFLQHPGGGKRDGLIHAIYGGVYGKDQGAIYEHPWTAPTLMPVLVHMGPAAVAGLIRYESGAFGPDYQDNLFACQFNMHKVSRHVLEPSGSTFKSRDSDFLVSDNFDFHPTCVVEDADGSLLVLDTGGWYKLCCPTSQLHKPDILGSIYRIRRKGMTRPADPRGLKLAWESMSAKELAELLGDARPPVRKRAIAALAAKKDEVLPVIGELLISSKAPTVARRNAIWTATQIDSAEARKLVRSVLRDPDETVAQVAIHSTSIWRDHEALPQLVGLLQSPSWHHRRAAAEALGRIGDRSAVPALLQAAGEPADRVLEHSLTYALIEIADAEGTRSHLASQNVGTRRAAMVALDQMEHGGLNPADLVADLNSTVPQFKETASWIVSLHPQWGPTLADYLRERLISVKEKDAELAAQLARFVKTPAVQRLLAEWAAKSGASLPARLTALSAMSQAGLREATRAWIDALIQALADHDPAIQRDAVATIRALNLPKKLPEELANALRTLAADSAQPAATRLGALAALPGGMKSVDPATLAYLFKSLDHEQAGTIRGLAADVIARAHLNNDQLSALAGTLKDVGPMELEHLLPAFADCDNEQVGLHLLEGLQAAPARSSLRVDAVRTALAKFGPNVQKRADELYAALDADILRQRARLDELVTKLNSGDIRRGQLIFNSPKAACSTCHAVGYKGGEVGPDLTRIGGIRNERDLLESIVFPSASFVRSYEPVVVATKEGKLHNGLIKKDTPEEIVLVLGANQEVRIARDDIETIQPSKVSVMPAGLDQQLSQSELADLVAFLKACK